MGTNYYRIPTEEDVLKRKKVLIDDINEMPIDSNSIREGFRSIGAWESDWDKISPWHKFKEGMSIHLGKRSSGWKFVWNFHENKFYSDKKTLIDFIKSGRVINEYGEELESDEFIKMALEWGYPDGWDLESYYKANPSGNHFINYHKEEYIDGLRISDTTEFS